jgi:hypothetical protein
LYRSKAAAYASEFGARILGIVIYALTLVKLKNEKQALSHLDSGMLFSQ